eukprot:SAG31_NODE_3180_length_4582_cov_2.985501_2_plen_350_part_00
MFRRGYSPRMNHVLLWTPEEETFPGYNHGWKSSSGRCNHLKPYPGREQYLQLTVKDRATAAERARNPPIARVGPDPLLTEPRQLPCFPGRAQLELQRAAAKKAIEADNVRQAAFNEKRRARQRAIDRTEALKSMADAAAVIKQTIPCAAPYSPAVCSRLSMPAVAARIIQDAERCEKRRDGVHEGNIVIGQQPMDRVQPQFGIASQPMAATKAVRNLLQDHNFAAAYDQWSSDHREHAISGENIRSAAVAVTAQAVSATSPARLQLTHSQTHAHGLQQDFLSARSGARAQLATTERNVADGGTIHTVDGSAVIVCRPAPPSAANPYYLHTVLNRKVIGKKLLSRFCAHY